MAEAFGLSEVRRALAEDRADQDITTRLLGAAAAQHASARFVAEQHFVLAGAPLLTTVFQALDPAAAVMGLTDGAWVAPGTVIATVVAAARALLAGERVALNFLQHLSGIATATRRAVDAVSGTHAQITHTRKTTPGLRALQIYAVKVGGGVENRASLADAVLWKDNHWELLGAGGGSIGDAVRQAPRAVPIVVEVESDAQLEAALDAGVTHLLVDNQSPVRLAAWVLRAGPGVTIQASGGITADTARAYADAGAKLIAIGALTNSVTAAPIRCDINAAVTPAVSTAPAPH